MNAFVFDFFYLEEALMGVSEGIVSQDSNGFSPPSFAQVCLVVLVVFTCINYNLVRARRFVDGAHYLLDNFQFDCFQALRTGKTVEFTKPIRTHAQDQGN
jgi:hypothetical protein